MKQMKVADVTEQETANCESLYSEIGEPIWSMIIVIVGRN
jgi:hypothetical protein